MVTAAPELKDKQQSFDTSIAEVPKCPETVWNSENIDLAAVQSPSRVLPVEITAADVPEGMSQEEFFRARRPELLEQLTAGGAIWLRGFDLMKTKEGFASFYEQLELEPCQDPLASVGARAVVDKKSAMYEAVNKPSRAKFFVGMHAESTYKRTNRLGAFVCFKQAETGGEFLLLDGHKMLKDLDPAVLRRLYDKGVRFSNAELPFFDFLRTLPEPLRPLKEPLKGVFKAVAQVAVGAKIDMELELRWDENEEDGLRLLAFSPTQPPVNRHPVTGEPAWFCNVHSHSRYLRDGRDGKLVESSGASKLNVTNMFYGDLSEVSADDLKHIDEVTMKNLVYVPMEKGDVVLVDNYQ
ncbi:hypothetical protein EMIHUDRAFT_446534, partial [Emiliania huxleyi CCMP1516]|uniref:TauD/TfdA-like domain-containing protein n=2 Tax=Emiliania huxleyi TaxID=2903 RepID=A0A0D3I4T7_EMIH1